MHRYKCVSDVISAYDNFWDDKPLLTTVDWVYSTRIEILTDRKIKTRNTTGSIQKFS